MGLNPSGNHVLLVDTNPPQLQGSMARYACLVELALQQLAASEAGFTFSRICLAYPWPIPGWVSGRWHAWINHSWLILVGLIKLNRSQADLYHLLDGSYAYVLGKSLAAKSIITVHDLIPLLNQQSRMSAPRGSTLAKNIMQASHDALRRSLKILADSESTRKDLQHLLEIDPGKVHVIHPPLDPVLLPDPAEQSVSVRPEQDPPIILHVGNNAWYKNREGVIRIFSKVLEQIPARLILAGPEPSKSMLDLVNSMSLQQHVRFESISSDDELRRLYQSCAVFLFPSLYEGFGWPPLEAMALGAPVVCSNAASLPEVVGDAGLMADAKNEVELADLCLKVLKDVDLAGDLRRKGKERVQSFTVEKFGKQILAVYQEVLNGPSPPSVAD